ncbi:hypothetical protein TX25_26180 [Pseudomonas lactis]|nr:carbohydrate porin [Pseudomonas lactis]KRP87179.1 hypothetical protein TX25_26180 [Pseudomonas lactis]
MMDTIFANFGGSQEWVLAGRLPSIDSAEQLIELSYGYQATPWLTLRPDVQYIIEPGAFSGESIDNALVLGLQVKAVF